MSSTRSRPWSLELKSKAKWGVLDTFFFWHRTLSRSERSIAAAVSFALAALLLALAIRFGQTPLRNLALLPGLGWVVLVASVLLDPEARAEDQAIITADEVVARVADSNVAPSPFPHTIHCHA